MEPAEGFSDTQLISSLILHNYGRGGERSKYERVERGGGQQKYLVSRHPYYICYMKVDFIHNESHDDLTKFCGQSLRFDFLIEKDGFNNIVIEFNGTQHYEVIGFGEIS